MEDKAIKIGVLFLALIVSSCDKHEKNIKYIQDTINNDVQAPKLVIIPAGKGTVGGKNFRSFNNEEPMRTITIEKDFALGQAEVTFAEYDAFCQAENRTCPEDEGWRREQQPVINVSWFDAVAYTEWLNKKTGKHYRLPSENEWEYAARAGQSSRFWWGDDYQVGVDHCDRDVGGCPKGTDVGHPIPAGLFQQNPFGLFDVTSNVSEWVMDCKSKDHKSTPSNADAYLDGDCSSRMIKGGNWANPQPNVQLSKRFSLDPRDRGRQVGFRVARDL